MIDFVCFSLNNWEKRKARKQQFMLHLSKREDVGQVLYVEPPINIFRLLFFPVSELNGAENRKRWLRALKCKTEAISNKLFIFTPIFFIPFAFRIQLIYNLNLFFSYLIIRLKTRRLQFKNIVLWVYHPFDYALLRWFRDKKASIFDWAEDWADYFIEFSALKRNKIKLLEERIVNEVDIVFVVSKKLLNRANVINKHSYQILDGSSLDLFLKEVPIPKDIVNLQRPIIGYTGTITERIDIELIEFISECLPKATILFIGDILNQRVNISSLKERKNIHFLGVKSYEELPAYIKNFDVCILPYRTDLELSPPTKIFDYLASGRPVISTNIPEINWLKDCIEFSKTKEQFLEFIKNALRNDSLGSKRFRIEMAQKNSWSSRAAQIMESIKARGGIKKILVIPTEFIDPAKMKVRIIEIAQGLSLQYRVYLLKWNVSLSGEFLDRAWKCMLDLFNRKEAYKNGLFDIVKFPMLHRPLLLALKFNSYFLRKFIRQENIDIILSGSYYMFEVPKTKNIKYILDFADVPISENNTYFDKFIDRQIRLEVKKADAVTAISDGLVKYINKNYRRAAYQIPNGAYVSKLRLVSKAETDAIRNQHNLTGKWIIGYIGMIGSWVDVDFLVNVFREIKKEIPNATLLLVGPSPHLKLLRKEFSSEDIIITGAIEGEISRYFRCLDIGVLPHKKNLFQDLAFHIKLIEYSAARKIVVSTDLEETRHLNLPNIVLADLTIKDWVEAIRRAREMRWSSEWDKLIDPYDWSNIINKFSEIINRGS